MQGRYNLLDTSYAIPAAPIQAAEEIAGAILSFKYGERAPAREDHLSENMGNLDSIVQKTSDWSQDVTDRIVEDKRRFFGATAELLRHLIDERSKIKEANIARLDYKILQCGSYLLNIESWPPLSNPLAEAKRSNLGHAINRMESEKNNEIARGWSDQARLYQELQKVLGDYQAVMRRSQLLSGSYR
jgi:hypothetical protein